MRRSEIEKLDRESEAQWNRKYERVPAKVGTVPMNIWIDKEMAEGVMNCRWATQKEQVNNRRKVLNSIKRRSV